MTTYSYINLERVSTKVMAIQEMEKEIIKGEMGNWSMNKCFLEEPLNEDCCQISGR